MLTYRPQRREAGAKCFADQKRSGLADKDQECCLECVLDIVPIADERSTHVPHHRGMPLNERGQGGLGDVAVIHTAGGLKSFEKLTVRQAYQGTDCVQGPKISEHGVPSPLYHASRESSSATTHGCPTTLNIKARREDLFPRSQGTILKDWPKTKKRGPERSAKLELVRRNVFEAARYARTYGRLDA